MQNPKLDTIMLSDEQRQLVALVWKRYKNNMIMHHVLKSVGFMWLHELGQQSQTHGLELLAYLLIIDS